MPAKPKRLRKREIAHLLRAAAGVEGRQSFVMIGTGAVIARLKTVPLDRRATREIDIYVADADAADTLADRLACRACGGEGLRRGVEGSVLTFCSTGCDARHTPNESQAGDRWQRR